MRKKKATDPAGRFESFRRFRSYYLGVAIFFLARVMLDQGLVPALLVCLGGLALGLLGNWDARRESRATRPWQSNLRAACTLEPGPFANHPTLGFVVAGVRTKKPWPLGPPVLVVGWLDLTDEGLCWTPHGLAELEGYKSFVIPWGRITEVTTTKSGLPGNLFLSIQGDFGPSVSLETGSGELVKEILEAKRVTVPAGA